MCSLRGEDSLNKQLNAVEAVTFYWSHSVLYEKKHLLSVYDKLQLTLIL